MKQLLTIIPSMFFALFLIACGNETRQSEDDTPKSQNTEETMESASESIILKDEKLNAVFQHYIYLTTALTKADVLEAKIAANAIETGATGMTGAGSLTSMASKISTSTDIEEQRKAYETISIDMMKMVRQAGLVQGEVFVQFCPMAFDDQGASWLSSTKEVRNPYMGDKMMACGVNRESIR